MYILIHGCQKNGVDKTSPNQNTMIILNGVGSIIIHDVVVLGGPPVKKRSIHPWMSCEHLSTCVANCIHHSLSTSLPLLYVHTFDRC